MRATSKQIQAISAVIDIVYVSGIWRKGWAYIILELVKF